MTKSKLPNWITKKVKYYTDGGKDYPIYFPEDYGVGLTFKDKEGIEYTTVGEIPQKLHFEASSFKGISIGAIHYYGSIRLYETWLNYIKDGKLVHSSIGGSFSKIKPIEARGIDIEIRRIITPEELLDEDRWHGYHEGSLIEGFETEQELWEHAVSLIKKRFKGNWIIDIDGFRDGSKNGEINIKNLKK